MRFTTVSHYDDGLIVGDTFATTFFESEQQVIEIARIAIYQIPALPLTESISLIGS
jgi:hypothetical protein